MKATVKWTDGAMFVGESGSGHSVVMDGPEDLGGRNLAARPMEMRPNMARISWRLMNPSSLTWDHPGIGP